MRLSRARDAMRALAFVLALGVGAIAASARAEGETETETEASLLPDLDVASSDEELPSYGATARVARSDEGERAATTVTRDEMDERLARSAPDALRWVPGVSVQQTTHGQASPYVRGLTGQQVLLAFDGVRLNNGTYRQGPNQYFFTVDAATLDRIEVLRGSASTRWGADAIGGAVLAMPAEPTLDPSRDGFHLRPRAIGRFGSQDLDASGRLELDAQLGRDVAVLVGGGYRAAQPLQGAGVLTNPRDGQPALVPWVEADGRTQRGTGFRYATFDGRLVWRVAPELRVVAALYGFRQYDTPRADLCPPPISFERDCTIFAEQFRTMAYVSLRGAAGPDLREVDLTASYQRQHELRELRQPSLFATSQLRDDLDTFGLSTRLGSRRFVVSPDAGVVVRGGGELYVDALRSDGVLIDGLLGTVRALSRGLYADGSRYYTGGLFAEADVDLFRFLRVRSGLRAAFSGARAPANEPSGTQAVRSDFDAVVGRVGIEARAAQELSLLLNVDQGFRAPNLDDLTSRQIIGPGFQFENPGLGAERSITYEVGARLRVPRLTDAGGSLQADAWLYAMEVSGAITRAPRGFGDCPPDAPECRGAFSRFQLVNVPGSAWLLGAEVALRASLPFGLGASATLAYAWGEGPSPELSPAPGQERVPLSRVMPLNGTVEVRWAHEETRLVVGAALRWAIAQDRLSLSDRSDARIPLGGTPAYATVDLRAGWRFERHLHATLVFENVFDQVYRVHGSGINGPGRGLVAQVEGAL
jgi:iron complex outermembrane receptor protein/hemoglobin/transferrin/lactoferrin receptor protein